MFSYCDNDLFCEGVALADIARRAGTPAYVYSSRAILEAYQAYDEALDGVEHAICYAVKANANLAVLALLARAGSGFDIVSGGELFRVLRAGGDPAKVVFSGVGKTADEVDYALANGIHSFNCESEGELALIDALAARRGVQAGFAIRVNPDVDAATHPYISTGLARAQVRHRYRRGRRGLRARARLPQPGSPRGELPHRLADSRSAAAARGGGESGRAGAPPARRRPPHPRYRPRRRARRPLPQRGAKVRGSALSSRRCGRALKAAASP